MFWSAWFSFEVNCSFWSKICFYSSWKFFFHFWSSNPLGPDRFRIWIGIQPKMLDPDPDPYQMKRDPQPCSKVSMPSLNVLRYQRFCRHVHSVPKPVLVGDSSLPGKHYRLIRSTILYFGIFASVASRSATNLSNHLPPVSFHSHFYPRTDI